MTQIRYASLLATMWLIERLGNRQASRAQAPQKGSAIPVPASEQKKKGTRQYRLLTVQCKYLVCFYAFYYYILSSLYFAAQNVSGWTRPVQEFVQH